MDAASEQKTFGQKLQEKIAQSRFFTFSLLLHVVIVVLGGSVVLFHKAIDAPDFTSEGGDLMSTETNVQPPMEQPPDPTQQTATPDIPSITAPSVSAITTNTTNNTSFQMANIPVPVKIIAGDTKNLTDTTRAISSKMGKGFPGAMGGRMGGTSRMAAMKKEGGKDKSEKAKDRCR